MAPPLIPPIVPPIVQAVGGLVGGLVGGVVQTLGGVASFLGGGGNPSPNEQLQTRSVTMPGSFGGSALARARALYAAGGSAPQWVPPAFLSLPPGAIDDEFDGSTLNTAWKFFGYNTQTVLPFSGATDRATSSATPRASLGRRRSWLSFQLGTNNTEGYLTKPWTPPAGDWFLWCRAQGDGGVNPSRTQLIIAPDHGSVADAPKIAPGVSTYLSIGHGNSGGVPGIAQADALNGAGNTTQLDLSAGANRACFFGIFYRSGVNQWQCGAWYEDGETLLFPAATKSFTPTRVGFRGLDAGALQSVHAVDFVRLDTIARWSA